MKNVKKYKNWYINQEGIVFTTSKKYLGQLKEYNGYLTLDGYNIYIDQFSNYSKELFHTAHRQTIKIRINLIIMLITYLSSLLLIIAIIEEIISLLINYLKIQLV